MQEHYIATRIRAEQVRQLFRGLPYAILATIVIASALATILWSVLPHYQVLAWWLSMLLISAGRYGLYRRYLHAQRDGQNRLDTWESTFLLGVVFPGIAWGALALFLVPDDIVYQVICAWRYSRWRSTDALIPEVPHQGFCTFFAGAADYPVAAQ